MMKAFKKLLWLFFMVTLLVGACITVGFLSFGGMFALLMSILPSTLFVLVIPLSIAAMILSVVYDGQIFWQNTANAFNKLFLVSNYIRQEIATHYLEHVLKKRAKILTEDGADETPAFIKKYAALRALLDASRHKKLTPKDKEKQKQMKKQLHEMEKIFANELAISHQNGTEELRELQDWLKKNNQDKVIALITKRTYLFHATKLFSILSALVMGFGTIYLLAGEFAAIPLLAAIPLSVLPGVIIPMALIAGAAYGFLIYNAVTDMIMNKTFQKFWGRLKTDLRKGYLLFPLISLSLIGLTVVMTLCTAGTWWSIVKFTPPLFSWMAKIPAFIFGLGTAVIAASTLLFDLENTNETLSELKSYTKQNLFTLIKTSLVNAWQHCLASEGKMQRINPFRIALKITVTPLQLIFFVAHLVSMAGMGDRIPRIPEIISFLIGLLTEGLYDGHYFLPHLDSDHDHGHSHGHAGHDHGNDIPTKILKGAFVWLYFLAASWDWAWSTPKNPTTPSASWKKYWGGKACVEKEEYAFPDEGIDTNENISMLVSRIETHKHDHLSGVFFLKPGLAKEKGRALTELQKQLSAPDADIKVLLQDAKANPLYHRQRFYSAHKPKTVELIDSLIEKLPKAAPAA